MSGETQIVVAIAVVAVGAYLMGAFSTSGDPPRSPTSAYERLQSEIG